MYGFDAVGYQYFNQLLNHRTIVFNDSVGESVVEKVFIPLRDFEKDDSTEPVTLILNSSGGSVSDGFFLAYYLSQYSKPLNINVSITTLPPRTNMMVNSTTMKTIIIDNAHIHHDKCIFFMFYQLKLLILLNLGILITLSFFNVLIIDDSCLEEIRLPPV